MVGDSTRKPRQGKGVWWAPCWAWASWELPGSRGAWTDPGPTACAGRVDTTQRARWEEGSGLVVEDGCSAWERDTVD